MITQGDSIMTKAKMGWLIAVVSFVVCSISITGCGRSPLDSALTDLEKSYDQMTTIDAKVKAGDKAAEMEMLPLVEKIESTMKKLEAADKDWRLHGTPAQLKRMEDVLQRCDSIGKHPR